MERIQILISKLKEQAEQSASPSQMLVTVQMLQNELYQLQVSGNYTLGTSKVAVMLPKTVNISVPQEVTQKTTSKVERQSLVAEEEPAYSKSRTTSTRKTDQSNLLFDPLFEIPTLSHQQGVKEINEHISLQNESLNDRLKQDRTEVVEVLKHEPIKDLRKAIGINDRFVFINDLFRGDEPMYERSIKTINSFHIFPEAEYWINRELIVKLGWDKESELVRHFYQLVKRRFSSM
jgi:membrane-associated HD superfamily phosphohydrolase